MKIVTHNGSFHEDEIFGVAALRLASSGQRIEVVRTRDPEIIKTADIVIDVGGEYDGERKFDHHQGGIPPRENGIPYASFGLVWKKFGPELCGSENIAELFDLCMVQWIDAGDNGVMISTPLFKDVYPFTVADYVRLWKPTWKESVRDVDAIFLEQVAFAERLIEREIKNIKDEEEGRTRVEDTYQKSSDKRIIVLDRYYPWEEVMVSHPEPLFIAYPDLPRESWHVQAIRSDLSTYVNRKDFPEAWAGKRDGELAEITGVPDALFAHVGRFFAAAKSREGAVKLAELALAA